jgi:multidrug resistance protein, MATE family
MKAVDNRKIKDFASEPFFSLVTFQDLSYQAKIAMHQCVMGVWNWWGLEIFTFMAGYVSTTALAAQSILRAISQLIYMPTVGLRLATQLMVGKSVGAQRPFACRHYYRTSVKMAVAYSLLTAIVFVLFRSWIQYIFTTNEVVIAEMNGTWLIYTTFICIDQLQGVAVSALVVSGKQNMGGIITWIGYFLIGIGSISYNIFARHAPLRGIWLGATAAVTFNALSFLSVEFNTDWDRYVIEASERRTKDLNEVKRVEQENELRTRLLEEGPPT